MIPLTILWLLYFTLHSLLASSRPKDWVARQAKGLLPYYRITYNLIAGGGFLGIWLYQRTLIEHKLFQELPYLSYLGLALIITGAVLGLMALRSYDTGEFSGSSHLRGRSLADGGKLHTTGLNAWVRHPLYFATLLFFWGYFLWSQTDVALLVSGLMTGYVVVGSWLEEKKLVEMFGEEYRAYQKKVRMLIPFVF